MELAACFTQPGHDQRLSLRRFPHVHRRQSLRRGADLGRAGQQFRGCAGILEVCGRPAGIGCAWPVIPHRAQLKPGLRVRIVLKQDQPTGKLTEGIVKDILTSSPTHPHGIKVRLMDGQVGRVKEIVGAAPEE